MLLHDNTDNVIVHVDVPKEGVIMKGLIQSLGKYVAAVAGGLPEFSPAPDRLARLPAYFASLYEAWRGAFLDRQYVLLVSKGPNRNSTPAEIAGQYRVAARELGEPVAFVLPNLASFARQRLVQYRVPFVVPGRQMYLPQFLVDLRDGVSIRGQQPPSQGQHLSGPAQALLLYYLQKPRAPELCSLGVWAELLGYSAMTVTRIAAELDAARVCEITRSGRRTLLDFDHDCRALWDKALPLLRTPVRSRRHVRHVGRAPLRWQRAGHSALSRYSMLADAGREVVAAGSSEYARARAEGRIEELPFPDEGANDVERWRYRPEILTDGPAVDRLSLYLSMRDDPDERVQAALKHLLEGLPW